MKKIAEFAICIMLVIGLVGCGPVPVPGSSGQSKSIESEYGISKWFDCLHGDEMIIDGMREINLDEYPNVIFRWYSEKLEAVTEKETFTLFNGMPIWSVYFCDLTGDGKPELCSTISIGSGIVDNRIIIYDYAGDASYELSDRGKFDYVLNMQNGSLIVEKRVYMEDELVESGELIFQNETIQIKVE